MCANLHLLDIFSGSALALNLGPVNTEINIHAHSASEVEEPILPRPLSQSISFPRVCAWVSVQCVCSCMERHIYQSMYVVDREQLCIAGSLFHLSLCTRDQAQVTCTKRPFVC